MSKKKPFLIAVTSVFLFLLFSILFIFPSPSFALESVNHLRASVTEHGEVILTWSHVPGADGYIIRHMTENQSPFSYLDQVSGTNYTDQHAEKNVYNFYKVLPFYFIGETQVIQESSAYVYARPVDLDPVSGLHAQPTAAGNVFLSWAPVHGAEGYIIQRKTNSEEAFTHLFMLNSTYFTDQTAPEGMYSFYRVLPFKSIGGKPAFNPTSHYVYAMPKKIGPVENLRARPEGTSAILIRWDALPEAEGYVIQRKLQDESGFSHLYMLEGTSYLDTTPPVDEYSFYRVIPYRKIEGRLAFGNVSGYVYSMARSLSPVHNINASSLGRRGIELWWGAIDQAECYFVYRRVSGQSEYTYLGSSTTPDYWDRSPEWDEYNEYKVLAAKKVGDKYVYSTEGSSVTIFARQGPPLDAKLIAITFDDGPGNRTGEIIDALRSYDARVTFFVIGSNLTDGDHAATLKNASNAGHEIGNHSWSHPDFMDLGYSSAMSQIDKTNDIVRSITGKNPALFRFPYGSFDSTRLSWLSVPSISWSVDTRDWETRSASHVEQAILDGARDGAIILLHDIHSTTVTGFLRALPKLVNRGYYLVTVSEMFELKDQTLKPGVNYRRAE